MFATICARNQGIEGKKYLQVSFIMHFCIMDMPILSHQLTQPNHAYPNHSGTGHDLKNLNENMAGNSVY